MHVEISASRLPKAPNSLFVALGVGDADGEVEDRADAALPPEARTAMGAAGMLRAKRLFAKESLQEATLNVYAKLLGAPA